MDLSSNSEYQGQSQSQPSNRDYSLHGPEQSPHESFYAAPSERRQPQEHAYRVEYVQAGSVPIDAERFVDRRFAWPQQHAQTVDDAHNSARSDEYSALGIYDRPFNPVPRRIAGVVSTDSCSRGANSMDTTLYNGRDLGQCLPTITTYTYSPPPSSSSSSRPPPPTTSPSSTSSTSTTPMNSVLDFDSPTARQYGRLASTASAPMVGGHFHATSSQPPYLRSPPVGGGAGGSGGSGGGSGHHVHQIAPPPPVECRAEYTTMAGAPRLPSAGVPSPWSSGSTQDSFYAGFPSAEAPSASYTQHRHSISSSQSSPLVNLNSPSYPTASSHMGSHPPYSPAMSSYSQYNSAGHSQIYDGPTPRSHLDPPSIAAISHSQLQSSSSRYYLDHHGNALDAQLAAVDLFALGGGGGGSGGGGSSTSPNLSPFQHGNTVSLGGSTPSASDLSSAGDSPKLPQKLPPTIKRRPTQLRPEALIHQPRLQTLLQELLDAAWLKDAALPERTIVQAEADVGFGQVGETIFRAFLKPFQVETPGEGRHTVWRCLLCPSGTCKDFQRIDRAEDHIRHQFDYRKFVCGGMCGQKKCKKPFLTKVSLNAHIEHHRSPEYVQCEHCHQTLLKRNLKRHHTTHCGKLRASRK